MQKKNNNSVDIVEFRKKFHKFMQENNYDVANKAIQSYFQGLYQQEVSLVPLTHELAVRIGFSDTNSVNGKFRYSRIYDKDGRFMEISETEDGRIFWTCAKDLHWIAPLPYVHSLEMAMELCGMQIDVTKTLKQC